MEQGTPHTEDLEQLGWVKPAVAINGIGDVGLRQEQSVRHDGRMRQYFRVARSVLFSC